MNEHVITTNLNTATKDGLKSIGLDSRQATNLIKFRRQNGLFENFEDLIEIQWIGEVTVEKLKNNPAVVIEPALASEPKDDYRGHATLDDYPSPPPPPAQGPKDDSLSADLAEAVRKGKSFDEEDAGFEPVDEADVLSESNVRNIAGLQDDIVRWRTRAESYQRRANDLQSQYDDMLKNKNESIEAERQKRRDAEKKFENLQKALDRVNEKLQEKATELDAKREELAIRAAELKDALQVKSEIGQELESLKGELNTAHELIAQKNVEIDQLSTALAAVQKDLDESRKAQDEAQAEFLKFRNNLSNLLGNADVRTAISYEQLLAYTSVALQQDSNIPVLEKLTEMERELNHHLQKLMSLTTGQARVENLVKGLHQPPPPPQKQPAQQASRQRRRPGVNQTQVMTAHRPSAASQNFLAVWWAAFVAWCDKQGIRL